MQKLWGGRFNKATDLRVNRFQSSISFDRRLYREEIQGSIAHVRMLGHCGILPPGEVEVLAEGLKTVQRKLESETLQIDPEAEDIHTVVEMLLVAEVGEAGKKLHTARSRNDQVALDTRLYLRAEIGRIAGAIMDLQEILIQMAGDHLDTIMPGYTHLQPAQPVRFAHHLLAYHEMFARDLDRLKDCRRRMNLSPLGAGALAGVTYPVDREYTAGQLGFDGIVKNSMDAVSDRDYLIEFAAAASLLMMHLSRFCEELILWSSAESGFVEFDDGFSTGSSIMPQKKNPDVAELIRGKTGRVYGDLVALLTMLKGLPL
ncbi:MAG: argininosuccinate lyase, partial [Firmicutes bacterium]|nr:argininosuccinate lyase [Bacillota bacterium]